MSEVPSLYGGKLIGTDEQIQLARKLLKSGMWIEKVVEQTGVNVVGPYFKMSAESIQRERERLYEKARHDEAQALYHAEQKGRKEGRLEGQQEEKFEMARKPKAMGLPAHQISQVSRLSCSEIENL